MRGLDEMTSKNCSSFLQSTETVRMTKRREIKKIFKAGEFRQLLRKICPNQIPAEPQKTLVKKMM
jgi:hypothetical protein